MNMVPHGPVPEDAGETWFAAQDYFWAIGAGLLVHNSRADWRSFLAGYAPVIEQSPDAGRGWSLNEHRRTRAHGARADGPRSDVAPPDLGARTEHD